MPKLCHVEVCQSCGYTTKLVFTDGYVDERPATGHHDVCRSVVPKVMSVPDFYRTIRNRQRAVC